MQTEHMFVIWSCTRIKSDVLWVLNWFKNYPTPYTCSSFPTDCSNAVLLLQFFFVCASVV